VFVAVNARHGAVAERNTNPNVGVVVASRRSPRNPTLLIVIVVTLLSFQYPIGNGAPYAAYNPQL
jgi:hypothetical protein